jgi:flavodoxin
MYVNSVVIYASRYGNTRKIAEAIAAGLRSRGTAQVMSADDAPTTPPAGTDLVVIGGPTEQHGLTEAVVRFFDRMEPGALGGMAAVAFDTRLRWPRWLSGSAGAGITQRLRRAGARVIAPEESFFIKGTASAPGQNPELASGELERAAAWGASLASDAEAKALAAPGRAPQA